MSSTDFPYDIALSVLDRDEPLARDVSRLAEGLNTFLYSERQMDLIGNDGLEKLAAVFGREARTVAVLYRGGWGQTKWTRIEETAIKERYWNEGGNFLTLVRLDNSPLPPWFPATRVWADYGRLKAEGVAALLVERVRNAGGSVRQETPEELAVRIDGERAAEAERAAFLRSPQGVDAATASFRTLWEALLRIGPRIGATATHDPDCVLLWRDGFSVSVSWECPYNNTLNDAVLHVKEWRGRPDIGGRFHGEKHELTYKKFTFDRPSQDETMWVADRSKQIFSVGRLVDFLATMLLNRVRDKIRARE